MRRPYRTDLAYIHDVGHGDLARHAGGVIVRALREQRTPSGLIVDLGCGSGILAEQVAGAGYEVEGIDISAAMIARARRRAPAARFRLGSMHTAALPPAVAVTAIGECVNYLFDRQSAKPTALGALFRRIHHALLPGGLLLFDAAEPGRVRGRQPVKSHAEGADWAVLSTLQQDHRRRILSRHIITFRKVGAAYRREEEVHRLRLYPHSEIIEDLRRVGFVVRMLRSYAGWALPPGLVGYLARKPR